MAFVVKWRAHPGRFMFRLSFWMLPLACTPELWTPACSRLPGDLTKVQKTHIFAVDWSLTPLTSDSFIRDLLGFKNLVLADSFSFLSKTSVTKLFLTSKKSNTTEWLPKQSTSGFFVLCIYNVLRSADIKFLHNRKINT